jgi:phospholipid transport system substrate-binding protein
MRPMTLVLTAVWSCAAAVALAQGAPAAPAAAPAATTAPDASDPTALVQATAQGMLGDLDKNREEYRRDPKKIATLVDKYLMPHFDEETSARVVLGQFWRTATPEQRQRFINAFYHSLLANYGDALAEFTADRLKIYPTRLEPGATSATVRTEVRRRNGDLVSVNYSLRMTPQGWKAWDVVIDGISYVKSYREDFGAQIQSQGLETVIKRLESGEKPGQIAKQTGG